MAFRKESFRAAQKSGSVGVAWIVVLLMGVVVLSILMGCGGAQHLRHAMRTTGPYAARAPVTLLGTSGSSPISFPSAPLVELNRPITVDTRPTDEPVVQVGVLTSKNEDNEVLPLMGRKFAFNRGGRYEYYTMSGSHGTLSRLPVSCKGQNCSGEKGCDQVFSGDSIITGGTRKEYDVTMYDPAPYYR